MIKLLKYISISLLLTFSGCILFNNTDESADFYKHSDTNTITATKFNEEVYIWEWFNISTNRVK
jgi:hypothetical protein